MILFIGNFGCAENKRLSVGCEARQGFHTPPHVVSRKAHVNYPGDKCLSPFWAPFQRSLLGGGRLRVSGIRPRGSGSGIRGRVSGIRDPAVAVAVTDHRYGSLTRIPLRLRLRSRTRTTDWDLASVVGCRPSGSAGRGHRPRIRFL